MNSDGESSTGVRWALFCAHCALLPLAVNVPGVCEPTEWVDGVGSAANEARTHRVRRWRAPGVEWACQDGTRRGVFSGFGSRFFDRVGCRLLAGILKLAHTYTIQ